MNYWLSPQGQVWESEGFVSHYGMAINIIEDKFTDLLDEYALKEGERLYAGHDAVRELENRGFIRYMDWGMRPQWVIYNQKPTKVQIRKMFDLTGFIYK